MSLDSFARVPLLFGPSPVHRLERLSEHLGGEVEIWAKREDCNSGLAFGGNKTRKLEYLVSDALAQGCDTLVSIGGVQSNHTRQVAAVAAKLGEPAVAKGGAAIATVLIVPGNAETLAPLRALESKFRGEVGTSAWNGIAVARLCAADGAALRYDLTGLLASLRGGRLPHCWFH